jgi:hypothetical protein
VPPALPPRLRAVLSAALLAAAAAWVYVDKAAVKMPDLEVYWQAGQRAVRAEPLYRAEDEHYQLKYLPAFAVVAIPLGAVPLDAAKALWFATSLGLLVAVFPLALRVLPRQRVATRWLVAASVITLGKFYAHEIVLGQVNLLLLALVLGALVAMRAGREATAGALLALAAVIKPHALLLMPWLAARRQVLSMSTATMGLLLAGLAPVPLYGVQGTIDLHRAWFATVTTSTPALLFNQDNVSLAGVITRYHGPGALATGLTAFAGLAFLSAAAVVVARRRGLAFPEALEVSLLLILMPLLSPQGWDYVLLVATPAVMLLANDLDRLHVRYRAVLVGAALLMGLSLYDVMGRSGYRTFMLAGGITFCALSLAAGLIALRRTRVA